MTVCIVAACRSPVVPRGGALQTFEPHELAAPVIRHALAIAGILYDAVDEVILSAALGQGGNPARIAALAAGLPHRVAGLTLDRQCAGGLDALLLAKALIDSGAAEVVVAGGAESYSRRPLRARTFADGRPPEPYDQAPFTPWPDRDPDMADAAETLARQTGISRAAQDDWAIASHRKALSVDFDRAELLPMGGLARDPFARRLSERLCSRAKVVTGSITAANAAVAADGAAFCVVVSDSYAKRHCSDQITLLGGATRGGDPEMPGLAPVVAIRETMERTDLPPTDFAAVEIMEAYAVQAIACIRASGIQPEVVNLGGGALARGHPVGASGTVNAVRLFHTLRRTGGTGLAAIAAAGGIGSALVLRA